MVESLGRMRRVLIAAVALGSVGLGWVMLWHVTPPGVATNLQTSVLATVVALQVLPVLAWFAWRADREVAAEAGGGVREAVTAEGVREAAREARDAGRDGGRDPGRDGGRDGGRGGREVVRGPERPGEVLAVHRVVHVPRAKPGRTHGPHVGPVGGDPRRP